MSKKLISAIFVLIIAGIGAFYFFSRPHEPIRRADQGQPQKSVDAILQERANQASAQLQSPLGKAVLSKDWLEFKKIYNPANQYLQFAEIIRAMYVQNLFSNFGKEDLEQLLSFTYDTLERLEPKAYHQSGLLVTQFYRMPLPAKNSALYQRLDAWTQHHSGTSSFLRKLAVSKIVIQDLSPPEAVVKAFVDGYRNPIEGATSTEWIRSTDDIRSPSVRLHCIQELLKLYPKLKADEQAQVLIVASKETKTQPKQLYPLVLKSLQSNENTTFEAGLRALALLVPREPLPSNQKAAVVKRLTETPQYLKTPFVNSKLEEVLQLLK